MRTDEWTDPAHATANRSRRPCSARHVSRATARALRFPAEPPATKQPPESAGRPASPVSHSRAAFSAATAPPASCQFSPENDHAPTTASNNAAVVAGAAGM